jgi:hypothetical protein
VSSRLSTAPKLMRTPSTEGAGLGLSLFVFLRQNIAILRI